MNSELEYYKTLIKKKSRGLDFFHAVVEVLLESGIDPFEYINKDITTTSGTQMGKKKNQKRTEAKAKLETLEPQTKKKFHPKDLLPVEPLTDNQELFFNIYNNTEKHLVLSGSAGVGKTFLSLYKLLGDVLDKRYDKLIIIRSAVQTRDVGFTPGTAEEKAAMFETPYMNIFDNFFKYKNSYMNMKENGLIEFHTTSFIRGTTFDNCAIFVDEAKSMNFGELDSLITRVGENSRIIFGGDPTHQNDLNKSRYDISGFEQFMKIIEKIHKHFEIIKFTHDDIVRSDLCREYIIARDEMEEKQEILCS